MLSVDENTPASAIPNTGTWYSGTVNSTKYFDISIAGKCETGTSDRVKLDVQPASEIPSFFSKNKAGKIVFAEPQVVGTIKAAKGHNSWVKVELKTVNGDLTSDVAKHVCLGIKKNDEDDFFDIIHAGNLVSRYVDVTQESHIELVPLLSKTATTESTGYVTVTPGTEIAFTDITIPTAGEFNFGSVYRVNVSIHEGQWIVGQTCGLDSIYRGAWDNLGKIGVGPVTDQSDKVHENQLFAISVELSKLTYSSDGARWTENGSLEDTHWCAGLAYGNGIWCAISGSTHLVERSTDGGKTWSATSNIGTYLLNFANGVFMTVTDANPGIVCISPDAEIWSQVNSSSMKFWSRVLIYGAGKWICGSNSGYVCQSTDNGKTWEEISDDLYQMYRSKYDAYSVYGGCYVNGYFYVICSTGEIARSPDGVKWKKVFDFTESNTNSVGNAITAYKNITYYKNKLWVFSYDGQKYVVGLFNPDGTIESLE